MHSYKLTEEPEGPQRGGSFNDDGIGGEANNFREIGRRLYGYVQTPAKGAGLNLRRISPAAKETSLSGILVAMFATKPEGGQCLIGWYRDATCHARSADRPSGVKGIYNFVADASSGVLLPVTERTHQPPGRLDGGFGQANVRYAYDDSGQLDLQPWMKQTIAWIRRYRGPNLLDDTVVHEELEVRPRGGQGRGLSAEERRAVEERAMVVAKRFFGERGYDIADVHKTKPYDLECRQGRTTLRVEVKGTTAEEATHVTLTRGEVRSARDPSGRTALFVVSGIALGNRRERVVASGGTAGWIDDWEPEEEDLVATEYRYRVPRALLRKIG